MRRASVNPFRSIKSAVYGSLQELKIMNQTNLSKRAGYGIFTLLLIFLTYTPYIYFNFGFHNDFEIWSYDNKVCCSGFPETPHLIRIGRFLQAYLQNIFLSFFTDLESLAYGRFLGVLFAGLSGIILSSLARKNGMGRLPSAVLGAAACLLPPVQVNLAWLTNFIPGLFNLALVLVVSSIFPGWQSILAKEKGKRLQLGLCVLLLLAVLFIYPPTAGFFLLPALIRILYVGVENKTERTQAIYHLAFFGSVCLAYFVFHRFVYMRLFQITFHDSEFYRFELSTAIWNNLTVFSREILPVMMNLFNAAPSPLISMGVFLVFVAAVTLSIQRSSPRQFAWESLLLLTIFLWMNVPGLLTGGGPPTFYRSWHPGFTAMLFFFIRSIEALLRPATTRIILLALPITGGAFAFDSSLYVATTLAKQYEYSVQQVHAQFSRDRKRYIIVEMRPKSTLFGRPRWGELGFIHFLTPGHVSYILKQDFQLRALPAVESLVARQEQNSFFLETEFLAPSEWLFKRLWSHPLNEPFSNAFDLSVNSFFEKTGRFPTTMDIVGEEPEKIECYRFFLGSDPVPQSMPRAWRLTGSNDRKSWTVLDQQKNQGHWQATQSRMFHPKKKGAFANYRLEFKSGNQVDRLTIPEILLFTKTLACKPPPLTYKTGDPLTLIPPRSGAKLPSVNFAGFVTESGLSTPYARPFRAVDNIYYSFWETFAVFPIDFDFHLFEAKQVKCYSLQAGIDHTPDRMPKSWKVLGSRNRTDWTLLDEQQNETAWAESSRRNYIITAPNSYRFYRLEFLSTNGANNLRIYGIALSEDRDCLKMIP